MVNWREDFETRRRFEAARRLIYSHPSVTNRCRSKQVKSAPVENINNNKEQKNKDKNLPSLTNIKICKLNLKARFGKPKKERSFPTSSAPIIAASNIFPSIKKCSNDVRNKCFLFNNYSETRSSIFFEGWGERRRRVQEIYSTAPPHHSIIDLQIKSIDPVLKTDAVINNPSR